MQCIKEDTKYCFNHPLSAHSPLCLPAGAQIGQKDTTEAAKNAAGLLFFEALFLSFRSLFTALFTFPSEFKMMLKVSHALLTLEQAVLG
jgi:hypothetical protein